MKSFKRLFSGTVINSLVTYRKNIGQEIDNLNFRTDVVKAFLVKYAIHVAMILTRQKPGLKKTIFSKNNTST